MQRVLPCVHDCRMGEHGPHASVQSAAARLMTLSCWTTFERHGQYILTQVLDCMSHMSPAYTRRTRPFPPVPGSLASPFGIR